MNPVLQEVFDTRKFQSKKNGTVSIHSETDKAQCELLQSIIARNKFKSSLEIGLAYGISALTITEAISANGGHHTAIDKFQTHDWKGVGLELVERAGFGKQMEFHEEYSYLMLPKFLEQKKQFDFAYIDSTKL